MDASNLTIKSWQESLLGLAELRYSNPSSLGANVILCSGGGKYFTHEVLIRRFTKIFDFIPTLDNTLPELRDANGSLVFILPGLREDSLTALIDFLYTGEAVFPKAVIKDLKVLLKTNILMACSPEPVPAVKKRMHTGNNEGYSDPLDPISIEAEAAKGNDIEYGEFELNNEEVGFCEGSEDIATETLRHCEDIGAINNDVIEEESAGLTHENIGIKNTSKCWPEGCCRYNCTANFSDEETLEMRAYYEKCKRFEKKLYIQSLCRRADELGKRARRRLKPRIIYSLQKNDGSAFTVCRKVFCKTFKIDYSNSKMIDSALDNIDEDGLPRRQKGYLGKEKNHQLHESLKHHILTHHPSRAHDRKIQLSDMYRHYLELHPPGHPLHCGKSCYYLKLQELNVKPLSKSTIHTIIM